MKKFSRVIIVSLVRVVSGMVLKVFVVMLVNVVLMVMRFSSCFCGSQLSVDGDMLIKSCQSSNVAADLERIYQLFQ